MIHGLNISLVVSTAPYTAPKYLSLFPFSFHYCHLLHLFVSSQGIFLTEITHYQITILSEATLPYKSNQILFVWQCSYPEEKMCLTKAKNNKKKKLKSIPRSTLPKYFFYIEIPLNDKNKNTLCYSGTGAWHCKMLAYIWG